MVVRRRTWWTVVGAWGFELTLLWVVSVFAIIAINYRNTAFGLTLLFLGLLIHFGMKAHTKAHREYLAHYGNGEVPGNWRSDQAWRRPTGIPYLEKLKQELLETEQFAMQAWMALKIVRQPNFLTSLQVGGRDSAHIIECAEAVEQLDRLWTGDVFAETEVLKHTIEKLERRVARLPERSNKRTLLQDEVAEKRKDLRELEEIKKRAAGRIPTVSPSQVAAQTAAEVDEIDMVEKARDRISEPLTKVEAARQLNIKIRKIQTDQDFSDVEKEKFVAELKRASEALFSESKAVGRVRIFKD